MSLFGRDIVTFGGDHNDLVWMYNASADKKLTIVAEAPFEVVYFKNGTVEGTYKNQKVDHDRSIFGRQDSVDKYYFINTRKPCQTNWGTSQKLEYKDAGSGKIISIGANGVISFYISDSIKFMEKVLGSRDRYTANDLTSEMLPKIFDDFNENLLSVFQSESVTYDRMDGMLKEIGARMLPKINESLGKYGVHVEEFIIKQFVKPGELKERANILAEKAEEFDDAMLNGDRRVALLKKQEEIEKQLMQMDQDRSDHKVDLQKRVAQLAADIEKMGYEAKGMTYKELREMDQADVTVAGDAAAKVVEAGRDPDGTVVVIKGENTGKCPYCDGEITASQIFCPTCKKKVI